MKITVYTLPDCVQCDMTKKMFTRENISYETVDLSTDENALNKVRELGYAAAPVVIAGDKHWSGFRIAEIKNVIAEIDLEKVRQ